ncbi:methylenetetrahydrofolate reductase [Helicobacter jaachi]|uniref:Methylenetetrahydrofolate reductase n=1 Tax=Helicobacter jaachi TaxID=1677920 RepID=A0A4V6I2U1_9HELI|nr:methylenetetrahydrofolate reductase [Helicobacter jaachi]TLD97442.1 methylenetetrahydrofolate reductase [Helicobacter jaachi]
MEINIESLVAKLHSKEAFLSLEISPSLSSRLDVEFINELKSLKGVDGFVCTDSPLARFKPSSILSSIKFQNALQKPVICTLSMRDRNSLALCGDILAANEMGLRAFLTLTGDSIKNGDCVGAKGVFEDNSLKLGAIIDGLNNGIAVNGKPLKEPIERIYNFQVINSYANNLQSLKHKIRKKLSSNRLSALFTQPVYSLEGAEFLLKSLEEINAEYELDCALVLGFFPVMSYKIALFLRDKLPGVYIPDTWVDKLHTAHAKGIVEEQKVGLEMSLSLFESLKKLHNKFHFMSANKPSLLEYFRI